MTQMKHVLSLVHITARNSFSQSDLRTAFINLVWSNKRGIN
jgi:hypothetical protein